MAKKFIPLVLGFLVISVHFFTFQYQQTGDPDYFYHVALSRQMQNDPLPRTISAFSGIGWDKEFVDKEFLFHQVTSLAYRIDGERGVALVPYFLSLVTWFLLWKIAGSISILAGVSILLITYLLSFYSSYRWGLLRPHTLAIPIFLVIFYALRERKRFLVLISCCLFSLAYHALQVPLALFVAFNFSLKPPDPLARRTLFFGLVGLLVGLLVHPYYPSVLFVAFQHLKIAFDITGSSNLSYGMELYPWSSSQLLLSNLPFVAVIALAIRANYIRSFVFLAAVGFWALAFLSPRAMEYAQPLTGLLLAELFLKNKLKDLLAYAVLLFAMLAQTYRFTTEVQGALEYTRNREEPSHEKVIAAVKNLPLKGSNRVFTCRWDSGSLLYYANPQLSYLDLLDPTFLYIADPEGHKLRDEINAGRIGDLYGVLREYFDSEYVFCSSPTVLSALERDPRFTRIVPVKNEESEFAIFALKEKTALSNYVDHYDVATLPWLPAQERVTLKPSSEIEWEEWDRRLFYLDLRKWFKSPLEKELEGIKDTKQAKVLLKKTICTWVRPKATPLHVGATYVGVGGGANYRIWMNGKPLFENVGERDELRLVDTLIPLDQPFKTSDRLEALVCNRLSSSFSGMAFSFWKDDEINEFCHERTNPYVTNRADKAVWKYMGIWKATCLAPIAVKAKNKGPD